MVAAVKVVIDKYFPVAVDVESAAIEIMKLADAERRHALYQPAQKLAQGPSLRIEIHEDKNLPSFDSDRNKAILCAVEIPHTIELRHAFQGAVQSVLPAMVRTLQNGRLTAGL